MTKNSLHTHNYTTTIEIRRPFQDSDPEPPIILSSTMTESTPNGDDKRPADDAANDEVEAATKKQKTEQDDLLAQTHAFGKLILFGEHFVVYKAPALVGAVAAYTDCKMEFIADSTEVEVIDNRPAVPNYKDQKKDEGDAAIALVLKHFNLNGKGCKLTFGGDLTCASGIGASAAQVVSLARAIKQTVPLPNLTEDEINAAGYEGEKGYHGTPSGIDNTAATFGGLLRFQRTDGDPLFEKKVIKEPIRIVYASTGITASTTKVVGDVRDKKEANPEWFDGLMTKYLDLVERGEKAVDNGDMAQLGGLLNENHTLCQELTVSCKELDDLVEAARNAGAIGAKMSGTGRGGLMLALTPTEEVQDAVASALEKFAPQVWKTTFC
jgi:mevalonate kinase